jgi:acyl transferase domain-containing protein
MDVVRQTFGDQNEGKDRDQPLLVSSSKTVFGHGHEYSGLLGLLRSILCIQHQAVTPNMHLDDDESYPEKNIVVPATLSPLQRRKDDSAFIAAIASNGYAGAMAHCVIGEHRAGGRLHQQQPAQTQADSLHLLISAKSAGSLQRLLVDYRDVLAQNQLSQGTLRRMCNISQVGRDHMPYRASMVGWSQDDLLDQLSTKLPSSSAIKRCPPRYQLNLLFPGQGSSANYWAIGQQLCEQHVSFRIAAEEAAQCLVAESQDRLPLLNFMHSEPAADDSQWDSSVFQLFILQCQTMSLDTVLAKLLLLALLAH